MRDVKYNFKSKELLQIDDFENIDYLVDDIIKSVKHLRAYEVLLYTVKLSLFKVYYTICLESLWIFQ